MKNMKVRQKLIVSFLIIAIITAVVGIMGVIGLLTLNKNEGTMYNLSVNGGYAKELGINIQKQRAAYRDVIMNINNTAKQESAVTLLNELDKEYDELFRFLDEHILTEKGQAFLDEINSSYSKSFKPLREQMVTAAIGGNADEANRIMDNMVEPMGVITNAASDLSDYATQVSSDTNNNDTATAYTLITVVAVLAVASVIAAMVLGLYISGLISKPLIVMSSFLKKAGSTGDINLRAEDQEAIGKYSQIRDEIGECVGSCASFVSRILDVGKSLESIAGGDLTTELALLSENDVMGLSLQKMVSGLNNAFSEIRSSSAQVSIGSKQVADGSQSLAQGATEQAASVQELSSSIAEIARKTKDNAKMAGNAAALANTIKGNAEKGNQQMDNMMEAVKEINQASHEINKVIKVIDDIAFQTNILALNAAVEAARAGQYGKGFAVVAEEVRNLAGKSAEAAKETGTLITNSMEKAELGVRIAAETSKSLIEIVSGINESSQIVNDIAVSSDEQTGAIDQINIGVEQVSQVVQQNSATAEQSAAASEEMSGQANILEELISQFKLKDVHMHHDTFTPALHGRKHAVKYSMPASQNDLYGKY